MNRIKKRTFAAALLASSIGMALAPANAGTPTTGKPSQSNPVNTNKIQPAQSTQTPPKTAPTTRPYTSSKPKVQDMTGVTVTPVRASLESAQEIERNSDNIVSSIAAEDIGKFPDNSVAGALSHVTDVQVTHNNGQVDSVIIRGLPNEITTLDGRKLFSATSRNFSFQDMPAEAVSGVDVYKTASANLAAGSISGVVNIKLHKPFDFRGFKMGGSVRETHSRIADKNDPNASFLVSNRWNTSLGEFGALVDVSVLKQHFDFPKTFNDIRTPFSNTPTGNTILVPARVAAIYQQGNRRRHQINYALQWKPMEHLQLFTTGFYSGTRTKKQQDLFVIQPQTATSSNKLTTLDDSTPGGCATVSGAHDCTLTSGTFYNSNVYASTRAYRNSDFDSQYALGGKWDSGNLVINSSVAYTNTASRSSEVIVQTMLPNTVASINTSEDDRATYVLQGNPQLDKNNFVMGTFNPVYDNSKSSEWALKGDAKYYFHDGFIQSIEGGYRYAYRTFVSTQRSEGQLSAPSQENTESAFPGSLSLSPGEIPYLTEDQWYGFNANYIFNNIDKIRSFFGVPVGQEPPLLTNPFTGQERDLSAYLQASYGFDLGPWPVDGLIGIREEKIQRGLQASKQINGVYSPVVSNSEEYVGLPNVSARIHLTDDLQLRLSATKTFNEPDFSDLNPTVTLAPNDANIVEGSGGNPDLKPIKSNNYDVALDWYFSDSGAASITGFYKKINGYIEHYASNDDIAGTTYIVYRPQSTGSGYLKGAAFSYHQFFDSLPGPLSGLGTEINFTYIKGATQSPIGVENGSSVTPITGVSHRNYNVSLIYEKYGISSRLQLTHRSAYIDSFDPSGEQLPQTVVVKPNNRLELSINYALSKHCTLTMAGTNLTRSHYRSYYGRPFDVQDYRAYETTYSIGARFEF